MSRINWPVPSPEIANARMPHSKISIANEDTLILQMVLQTPSPPLLFSVVQFFIFKSNSHVCLDRCQRHQVPFNLHPASPPAKPFCLPLELRSLSSLQLRITPHPLASHAPPITHPFSLAIFPSLHISPPKSLAHLHAVARITPTSTKSTPPNTIFPSPLRKQNPPSTPVQTIISHQLPCILRHFIFVNFHSKAGHIHIADNTAFFSSVNSFGFLRQ